MWVFCADQPHNILLAQCSKTDKANKAAARSQAAGGGASEPDRSVRELLWRPLARVGLPTSQAAFVAWA